MIGADPSFGRYLWLRMEGLAHPMPNEIGTDAQPVAFSDGVDSLHQLGHVRSCHTSVQWGRKWYIAKHPGPARVTCLLWRSLNSGWTVHSSGSTHRMHLGKGWFASRLIEGPGSELPPFR